jgi:hypothetical protein
MEEPLTVTINGQPVTASMDEWLRVQKVVDDRLVANRKRWEDEQRAAGKVWIAIYWRYGERFEEEFFSLNDAREFLTARAAGGDVSAEGIRCPDGSLERLPVPRRRGRPDPTGL